MLVQNWIYMPSDSGSVASVRENLNSSPTKQKD